MAEILVGPALGTALGKLLNTISEKTDKAFEFNSILNRLEGTLNSIIPIINKINELKQELDHPKEELEGLIKLLNKGVERVHKYSRVSCCNPMRVHYASKLQELDDSILRFFNINIRAQQTRENLQILIGLDEMRAKMDRDRMMLGEPSVGFKNPIELLGPCGVPKPPPNSVGLDVPLEELKMLLFKDGEKVLVLSAPVGCGKTTLAKMLCHDKEVKGNFMDNIFFVTVSKAPNLKVIIQRLLQHMGCGVPEFQNDGDAVNHLEQLLKQIEDPILLVLDDVWSGSESFLEKFVFQIPNYKILVTSRFVFPRFNSYKLKLMHNEDAKTLFCQSAFQQNGSSFLPDKDLVDKIVRTCKGFPLALIVVGRSLCGQPEEIWKSRAMEWSEGQSIFNFEFETDVFNYLKTSLDVLDNKVLLKECFMDLGSFPEDQRIPAAALIDMWAELYKLEDVYAMAILYELSTRNLVNLVVTRKDASEVDGYYNEYFVMLHDLLRELAAYQSRQDPMEQRKRLIIDISRNNIPKWFMDLKQQPIGAYLFSIFPGWLLPKCFMGLKRQPIGARFLSISTDGEFSSSWSDLRLPEIEVIVLNFETKNYTLPKFMKKMNKLKVLIVMNNGFCPAELTNFRLLASLSNLKRIRLEHISIPSLSSKQLKNLHKASFKMCKIGQAFSDSTIQLPGIMPNLVELNIDYCSDLVELPESLCDIIHLKKLSITNCHKLSKLPERIGDSANLEVLRLHACTELSELPSSVGSLHKLSFLDISDCLKLLRLPEEMGELCNLRKLHMRGCSSLSELPSSIINLRQLTDVFCDEETSSLWEALEFSLPDLEITVIKENINLDWLHNLQF